MSIDNNTPNYGWLISNNMLLSASDECFAGIIALKLYIVWIQGFIAFRNTAKLLQIYYINILKDKFNKQLYS